MITSHNFHQESPPTVTVDGFPSFVALNIDWGNSAIAIMAENAEQFIALGQQIEAAARALAVQAVTDSPDAAMIEEILERR